MSMTKEEAIECIKEIKASAWGYHIGGEILGNPYDEFREIMDTVVSALRPITREQAEKMRGKFFQAGIDDVAQDTWRCSRCLVQEFGNIQGINFCPSCGAPMTDKAVDMVMERLEALYEDSSSV